MPNRKQIITIAVLGLLAMALGYWYGLPKEGVGKTTTPNKTDPSGKVLPATGELIADPVLRKELAKILKIEEDKITPKKLSELTAFSLSRKGVESIQGLQHCVALKSLDLGYNKIVDLSPIVNMGKLETLYLDNNLIQKAPDFSKLIYITSLSFQNNDLRDILGLKAMDGLQTLDISGNKLLSELAPLTGLKRLKSLTAPNCKITDTTDLQLMKNLQSLNIQGNTIPQPELETLKTALPGCKILHN